MSWPLAGQAPDTALQAVPLRETVISANRVGQDRGAVAQQITTLDRNIIAQANAQSTADLLLQTGQVFIQKSQQGGGSPVLRGFEASRVLLVVDGVRLNNAIYRSGHLQNVITLDNAALDRAEVLFGPASTVYGSDALGGVLAFYTKNPVLAAPGEGFKTAGSAFVRYGTANGEKTGHADVSLAGERFGSFTSFTYGDFGDLRMGKNAGSEGSFGERPFYVERIGGRDSLVRNANPLVQKFSGYRQYDFLQKLLWRPSDRATHQLNVQYSTSSDMPRYDRLTDPGADGGLASAEWYYGPQERLLAAYSLTLYDLGWLDGLRATASWQDVEESRHNRNFGAPRRTSRIENVSVFGLLAEVSKNWGRNTLRIGLDGQYNDVTSKAFRTHVETGEITPQSTRYPDGGSTMGNLALYATHQWQPAGNDRWTFSEGLRIGYSRLDATFADTTFFPFPFRSAAQQNPIWSGSLGAVYSDDRWRLAVNAASGFRVPNVDDLGKVFDSAPGDVLVPNPDLKPEQTYNLDLSVTRRVADRLRWENVGWFTVFRNAIVTDEFLFNGQDSILFDGALSRVLANQNTREATIWGVSSVLEADVTGSLAAYASATYTRGRIRAGEGGADQPLDHIPPFYGRAGVRWHTPKANAEVFSLFNGKKKIEHYNREGEDNEQYAPPGGMPAWITLNLRGGYRFGRFFQLQAGVDNILDAQYRFFASGINAPGRNLWVTARVNW